MVIHNDMNVMVYVMLKKANTDFNKFLICIYVLDTGVFASICMNEIVGYETQHLIITQLVDPIVAFVSGDCNGMISDPYNKHVEIDPVYRTKQL
ncbi:hypothetical protein R3W88_014453 [Solanum pinnatisectum]|uniref:Uncharacterized protein n=1 Tax=Solanum pinnatisectum TaxID=50273 RepID=A0AAV9KU28_9SOLN|nr:hypothetical protein R3W88_014453 [Solanum pinnatisectum]